MFIQPDKLYQVAQIRQLEEYVIDEGISAEPVLMETAGAAALQALLETWPNAARIVVFAGLGNNAGDGFVLARLAVAEGLQVTVYQLGDTDELRPKDMAELAQQAGVIFHNFSAEASVEADVIVDALFGTGLARDVDSEYADAVKLINAQALPVLALDIPTGLNADNGRVMGSAVRADVTVTFLGLKQGMFTHNAANYCGKILCSDLNIPAETYRQISASAKLITWKQIRASLPRRQCNTHKGNYGHVLVVGGDYGMGGAVRMAAEAAMRVGAGLVSVATRPEHVAIVNCARPEIMCHQVVQANDLDRLIANSSVLVVGPGLGQSDWSKELYARVMQSHKPKVVDADALSLLSEAPMRSESWVLTPHPGEAARLLNTTTEELQDDRFAAVTELQQCYGGVAVLKGSGTIIKSDDPVPAVCRGGNPGMASGGMGDILTGIIAGLIAQGLDVFDAAEVGVFVHANAADRAAAQEGERGLLASDVLAQLRGVVNPG